ncbi:MAG: hypothetical protein J7M13_01100 [Synergistetes bacterium]|nr:hypothetical protein [Synergistota bacterium]
MLRRLALTLILILYFGGVALATLPHGGRVAVMFNNPLAEAKVMEKLINAGYNVVDRAQLDRIRRSRAAILALQGKAEAIMKLGRLYRIAYLVKGKAIIGGARENEFGLYTATASLSIQAYRTRNARFLLSKAFSAKAIGYTPSEAKRKALLKAASKAGAYLTGGEYAGAFRGIVKIVLRGVSDYGIVNSVYERVLGFPRAKKVRIVSYGGGQAIIEFLYSGDLRSIARALRSAGLPISVASVQGNVIYVNCY